MVSAPYAPTPPSGYAGIELIVSWYVEELLRRGHDVTTICVPGSTVGGKRLIWDPGDMELHAHIREPVFNEWFNDYMLYEGSKHDLVHDHTHLKGPSMYCDAFHVPFLNTCHLPNPPYTKNAVALSKAHAKTIDGNPVIIHLGVPTQEYPFCDEKKDYFLYLGYIGPHKGVHIALAAAHEVDARLIIAGPHDHFKNYHEQHVVPDLDERRTYIGEVKGRMKLMLLAKAKAIVLPIQWEEPGSTVCFEALACGTPVIGNNRGALTDILEPAPRGTSCLVNPGAMEGIAFTVHMKNPPTDYWACRQYVQENWTVGSRVNLYEELYERVLAGETW